MRLMRPRFCVGFCLAAIFALSGCITGIDYGDFRHSELSAGPVCNPSETSGETPTTEDAAMFLVTSRLPDCTLATIQSGGKASRPKPAVRLTDFRSDRLRYGRVTMANVADKPKNNKHNRGEPSQAQSKANPRLASTAFAQEARWWADLEKSAASRGGGVMIYIHGFRETIHSSSRDAEQISRLAGFSAPMIQYSWPSEGELLSYGVDETNVSWDERKFRGFLLILAQKPWVTDITVITHSLGARLVLPSIEYVDRHIPAQSGSKINRITLASPDIDRQEFERDIGVTILSKERVEQGRRMAIYVSANDRALGFSRTIHGYPRLGRPFCYDPYEAAALAANGQLERCYAQSFQNDAFSAHGGLTVIDTSDVSAGRSGHSDYLRSAAACLDFAALLGGQRAQRTPTHLPHVFRIAAYAKGKKPDHRAVCKRR